MLHLTSPKIRRLLANCLLTGIRGFASGKKVGKCWLQRIRLNELLGRSGSGKPALLLQEISASITRAD